MGRRILNGLASLLLGGAVALGSVSNNTQRAFDGPEKPEQIAYVAETNKEDWDIYVRDLKGAHPPIKLVDSDRMDLDPCLSGDGKRLYFSSDRDGENFNIFFMNLGGVPKDPNEPSTVKLTEGIDNFRFPSPSPDGKRIAFSLDRGSNWDIYVMPAEGMGDDGGGLVRVTDGKGMDLRPRWLNNGKLVFTSNRGRGLMGFDIYFKNADGTGDAIRITDGVGSNNYLSLSPLGDRIAFASNREGRIKETKANRVTQGRIKEVVINEKRLYDIFSIGLDGKGLLNLTGGIWNNRFPFWSGNGDEIYFTSDRDGEDALYSVREDGKGEVKKVFDGLIYSPTCSH